MIKNIYKAFLVLLTISVVSCNKEEGTGGESSIKGIVFLKQMDRSGKTIISQLPASGEDVFISYGNGNTVDDRARIGIDGSFEFKYLREGDYKIFVYSDDTANWGDKTLIVAKTISVSGDDTKSTDTLFIFQGLDYNDGSGTIKGTLIVQDIDPVYGNVLSSYPAGDMDVFLSKANNSGVLDNVRTSTDGSFEFRKIIDGSYSVFSMSENLAGADSPVLKSTEVKNGGLSETDTIFVKKRLDIDDGSAIIKGRIYVYNFDKDNGIDLTSQYWGQDVEVYLIYGTGNAYHIRVRTSYDGSFEFSNLIKGKYRIFVYSAHRNSDGDLDGLDEDTPIFKNADIDTDGKIVDLGVINTEKL